MTFYQELQLNQAGSKNYIAGFEDPKDKAKHIAIYLFKILITNAFCILFMTLFSAIFGKENSIAGLALLMSMMAFRFSDFGIHTSHAVFCVFAVFGLFAIGPKMANLVPAGYAFGINLICIMLLMILGSHNVVMFNHSTFVLSYLLLQGYDVSGDAYKKRLLGLFVGAVITSVILYRNHRKITYKRSLKDLFEEFDLSSTRTRWQIRLTFGVSSALLIASVLGVPKGYWMGIAAMSVIMPFKKDLVKRVTFRGIGTVAGSALFVLIYFLLPESFHSYIGIIGGIGTGLSAHYGWQCAFNACSALSMAVSDIGLKYSIIYRIFNNLLIVVYILILDRVLEPVISFVNRKFEKHHSSAAKC